MIPAWRTWRRGDFIGVFTAADREGDSCGIGELHDEETRAGEAEEGEISFLRRSGGILECYFASIFLDESRAILLFSSIVEQMNRRVIIWVAS